MCSSCPTEYECTSCQHRQWFKDGVKEYIRCPECGGSMRPLT